MGHLEKDGFGQKYVMDDDERTAHLRANLAANSSGTNADSGEEPKPDFSAYKLLVNGKLVPVDKTTGQMIKEKKTESRHSALHRVNQVTPAVYERIQGLRQRFNSYASVALAGDNKQKKVPDEWETWSARGSVLGEVEQDVLGLQQDHTDSTRKVQSAIANLLLQVRTEMLRHQERQPKRFTFEWHRAAVEDENGRSGTPNTDSEGRPKKRKKKNKKKSGNTAPVFRKDRKPETQTSLAGPIQPPSAAEKERAREKRRKPKDKRQEGFLAGWARYLGSNIISR
jgi:hypothetical protein